MSSIFRYPSVQAAIATLCDQITIEKNNLDNVTRERDKLRFDIQVVFIFIQCVDRNIKDSIQEEHRRSTILALDADEQNCQNEKDKNEEFQVCVTFLF